MLFMESTLLNPRLGTIEKSLGIVVATRANCLCLCIHS